MLHHSYASCVAACLECIGACEDWLESMARGVPGEARYCADHCRSSIRLCRLVIEELKLRSAFSIQVCALGTVICRACAEECRAVMAPAAQVCAAACLRAAEECHAVATTTQAYVHA